MYESICLMTLMKGSGWRIWGPWVVGWGSLLCCYLSALANSLCCHFVPDEHMLQADSLKGEVYTVPVDFVEPASGFIKFVLTRLDCFL